MISLALRGVSFARKCGLGESSKLVPRRLLVKKLVVLGLLALMILVLALAVRSGDGVVEG